MMNDITDDKTSFNCEYSINEDAYTEAITDMIKLYMSPCDELDKVFNLNQKDSWSLYDEDCQELVEVPVDNKVVVDIFM